LPHNKASQAWWPKLAQFTISVVWGPRWLLRSWLAQLGLGHQQQPLAPATAALPLTGFTHATFPTVSVEQFTVLSCQSSTHSQTAGYLSPNGPTAGTPPPPRTSQSCSPMAVWPSPFSFLYTRLSAEKAGQMAEKLWVLQHYASTQ
jgi:hypothetical protein